MYGMISINAAIEDPKTMPFAASRQPAIKHIIATTDRQIIRIRECFLQSEISAEERPICGWLYGAYTKIIMKEIVM